MSDSRSYFDINRKCELDRKLKRGLVATAGWYNAATFATDRL